MYLQRRCRNHTCRRVVPPRPRSCPHCGSRDVAWLLRYQAPDGTERSRSFDRRLDAERFGASVEMSKLRGEWTNPAHARTPYADWIERWWTTRLDLRPSSRARDESYMRSYILDVFGPIHLGRIEQVDVRAWVADLSARGLAPATVQKAYQVFAKSMAAAVAADMIPRSPCRGIALPRIERQEMRFLTPDEIGRLADSIHPRYRALVLVGAYGGLRLGEIAGLRRHRVDLLRGRVDVAEIAVEVRGRLFFGPPKTKAGRRSVGLPRTVVRGLESHLATWAADDLVFTAPEGGPLRTPTFRRRFWQPAVISSDLPHRFNRGAEAGTCKCGLPVDSVTHDRPLRPHDLRHTAVALWIAADANPKEVAVRAGHMSVSFTLDRYGHLFPNHDDRLRARLDEMILAASWPRAEVVSLR